MSDVTPVTPAIPTEAPKPPSPTKKIEKDAENAVRYLNALATNPRIDVELRMGLGDIVNTLKTLKHTVHYQSAEAETNHEKMVEILRSIRRG